MPGFHNTILAPPEGASAVCCFGENREGRDFVVGDIHGMFGHLRMLLKQVSFDAEVDRLFSVGDLVDRCPGFSPAGATTSNSPSIPRTRISTTSG